MVRLIINENMKIFYRKSTLVFVGMIFLIILLIQFFAQEESTMWQTVYLTNELSIIVTICAIVVAASSMSSEFSAGTIKFLLTQPIHRTKILIAKYISVQMFVLFLFMVMGLTSILISGILHEFSDFLAKDTDQYYIFGLIPIYIGFFIKSIFFTTVAFMLSVLFLNHTVAVTICVLLHIFEPMIKFFIAQKLDLKYYLFHHTELITEYLQYGGNFEAYKDLAFSLFILALYWSIFVTLTWWFFRRKDISF